jgi:hypothetical protein
MTAPSAIAAGHAMRKGTGTIEGNNLEDEERLHGERGD